MIKSLVTKGNQAQSVQQIQQFILEVIAHPAVFQFTEFIEIFSAEQHSQIPSFVLLKLFAYGTINDYSVQVHGDLSTIAVQKLQLLTLIDMCNKDKILKLSDISKNVKLASTEEVEQLLIKAIGLELIKGKINQEQGQFRISSAISRDIQKDSNQEVKQRLQKILNQTRTVRVALQQKIDQIQVPSQKIALKQTADK